MATYRDGVKSKGDKIGMEYNSHIVCMCILMRWSRNLSANWAERFQTSSLLGTYKLCDYYTPIPILSPLLFTPSLYVAILNLQDFSFTCIIINNTYSAGMKERCRDGCRTFLVIAGVVLVPAIFHTSLPPCHPYITIHFMEMIFSTLGITIQLCPSSNPKKKKNTQLCPSAKPYLGGQTTITIGHLVSLHACMQ